MSTNKRVLESSSSAATASSTKRCCRQDPFKLRRLQAHERCRTNDEIHSTIDLCPVATALIGTPAFQRLRHIKQLGTAEHVYINCNHTRFEHSLGVMHLACSLCRRIRSHQPALGVTAKDVLCVRLAGLLHDIGHAPFSHVYETFVTTVLPKYRQEHPELDEQYQHVPDLPDGWRHESVSLLLIDAALEHLGLAVDLQRLDEPLKQIGDGVDARSMRVFDAHDDGGAASDDDDESSDSNKDKMMILTSRDFVFIKECIWGKPIPEVQEALGEKGYVGRPCPTKEWLYDIVCNSHSGLDVDKIDYFARDQRRAFRAAGEIENLMVDEAVVAWAKCTKPPGSCVRCDDNSSNDGKHLMICYPEKMVERCLDFFKVRERLHAKIYKHKTVMSAMYLIIDILCKADPYFRISTTASGNFGKAKKEFSSLPLSRAMLDPVSFLELDDSIIEWILHDPDPRLAAAQKLIRENLRARCLYKEAVSRPIHVSVPAQRQLWNKEDTEIEEEMLMLCDKFGGQHVSPDGSIVSLEKGDFIVDRFTTHHGQKDRNPLNNMRFVRKGRLRELGRPIDQLPRAVEIEESEYSAQLPRQFQSHTLRVFSRDPQKVDLVSHIFGQWFEEMTSEAEATPEELFEQGGPLQQPILLSQEDEEDEENWHDNGGGGGFLLSPKPNAATNGHTPKITPVRQAPKHLYR